MKNEIKNMFLMGVGAASLTKKKAEKTIKIFVKKGVIDNKQAREIIEKVMKETNKVKSKLKKEGAREVKKVKKKIVSTKKKATKKVKRTVKSAARKIVRKGMKL